MGWSSGDKESNATRHSNMDSAKSPRTGRHSGMRLIRLVWKNEVGYGPFVVPTRDVRQVQGLVAIESQSTSEFADTVVDRV